MGGHNQETQTQQTQQATQVAEASATEGGTAETSSPGPQFTSRGPIPRAAHGFKDPPQSPSDAAYGSPPIDPTSTPEAMTRRLLSIAQRSRLETEFVGRVSAAELAYVTALTDLRVDKLVEKEEELPIWLTLLVGVGGIAMESTVTSAIKLLKKSGQAAQTIEDLGAGAAEHAVEDRVAGMSEGTVEKLVGQLVDKAKEKTLAAAGKPGSAAPAGGAVGDGEEEQKPATLNYIDYLRDRALVLFQNVREEKLSSASDEELLGVFASFDAKLHTVTMYRAKLEEQIKLYLGSHAKEIGHRMTYSREQSNASAPGMVREEVRVARILIGGTERYAYVSREYGLPYGKSGGVMEPGGAYQSNENALSFEEEGSWEEQPSMNQPYLIPRSGHADAVPDQILGYVEPELVDVALASQDKRWLQKMDTYRLEFSATGRQTITKVSP